MRSGVLTGNDTSSHLGTPRLGLISDKVFNVSASCQTQITSSRITSTMSAFQVV